MAVRNEIDKFVADPVGALTGKTDRKDEDAAAEDALQQMLDEAGGLTAPTLDGVQLEDTPYLGDFAPEQIAGVADINVDPVALERAVQERVGKSNFEGLTTDPALRDKQMASLAALQELADNGGMTAMDRANLNRVQGQAAQADRGRREAILQNQRMRGMAGSGNELLAQLASSQAATDQQSQQGLDIAGMAQQRALDAMLRGGELAGGIRGQDWGEAAQRAAAMDEIAKFNAGQANQMSTWNAGAANQMGQFNTETGMRADMFNTGNTLDTQKYNAGLAQDAGMASWGARQNNANTNTGTHNTQTMHNSYTVPMSNFGMQQGAVDTKAGAHGAAMGYYTHQGDKEQEGKQDLVSGVLKAAPAMVTAMSDERAKKDVKKVDDVDLDHFLATLSNNRFEYKDKKHGEGHRTGPMAQDLLKSELGADTVVQGEDGMLAVDQGKLQGVLIAAIKHLSEKIDGKKKVS